MLARSWLEHRYKEVAVLAPMVSCQALNLCQSVSSVHAGVGVMYALMLMLMRGLKPAAA
jgi:hypothetical protein